MKKDNRYEIRIVGFGGQGIVTIGRILGEAFTIYEGKNSVNTQSYGPESRGGACRSEVVVSDGQIHYPNVKKADILIALSQVGLNTYLHDLKEGGILIIDPDLVNTIPNQDKYKVHKIPTVKIASEAGGLKYQNSVALGALFPLIGHMIKESSLREAISNNVPPQTIDFNMEAFDRGMSYDKKYQGK